MSINSNAPSNGNTFAACNLENSPSISEFSDDAMPHHPIAELFPRLTEKEMAELSEDIAVSGQREPGVVWKGMLLDGLSRGAPTVTHQSCEESSEKKRRASNV